MKQQVDDTRVSGLKWDHAIKGLYGLELPISAITNDMKRWKRATARGRNTCTTNTLENYRGRISSGLPVRSA